MQQIEAFVETGLFLYSLRREISYRVGLFVEIQLTFDFFSVLFSLR